METEYVIERNVPVKRVYRSRKNYPFSKMEVGDSFVTKNKSVRTSAYYFGKKYGSKFKVGVLEDSEFRVWRIK